MKEKGQAAGARNLAVEAELRDRFVCLLRLSRHFWSLTALVHVGVGQRHWQLREDIEDEAESNSATGRGWKVGAVLVDSRA